MQALLQYVMNEASEDHCCGADSYFFKLTEDVGVKLFMSPLMRDRNYERMQRWSDIAPKVGQKFKVKFYDITMYGYMVEVVNTYQDIRRKSENYSEFSKQWNQINNTIQTWLSASGQREFFNDLHSGNIGMTQDGRAVVLDFSRCVDPDGFVYHNLDDIAYANRNGRWERVAITNRGRNFAWIKND